MYKETMIHRTFKFRLRPTTAQVEQFERFAGTCRFIYNLGLEHREKMWTYYRDNGTTLNFFQQTKELTQLRAEVSWINDVPFACEEAALRDLDRAYSDFFAGRARYPRHRKRGVGDSFRFRGNSVPVRKISGRWSEARLPKLGWVKFRDTRAMPGTPKAVTVILDEQGWHISFACASEAAAPVNALPPIGIDRGVANTLALSNGEFYRLPLLGALDCRVKRAQRVLARRKLGSARRSVAKKRVTALRARVARIRKDWRHRASTDIAARFGTVAIEALNVLGMTASGKYKRGLNRSILAQGWTAFAGMLDYKLAERGGTLVTVNPAYTSQTCSHCGTIDKQSRESQARFVCRSCGFEAHADTNAAINILRGSTPSMRAEETGYGSNETRTRSGRKRAENHPAQGGMRLLRVGIPFNGVAP